jgi:hypothetical protein
MEGEYSDLSIDEKLDCLVALIDIVSGAGSVPRLEVIFCNCSSTQLHHAIFVLEKVDLTFLPN